MISKRNKLLIAGVSGLVAAMLFTVVLLVAFGIIKISADEARKCPLTVANPTFVANGYLLDESGNYRFSVSKGVAQQIVLEQKNTGCQNNIGDDLQLTNSNASVATVISSKRINIIEDGGTRRTPAFEVKIVGATPGNTVFTINNKQQLSIDVTSAT